MKKTLDGAHLFEAYDAHLAPYAQKNGASAGRQFPEHPDPNRLPFQRDRDRIIHTTAFRRLKGKMQVVPPGHGDHFRNRLTHTIEVAQLARDLARSLQLNEDLTEAIALAHDLGHPPFGHTGEQALDDKLREHDLRFDHNAQSLRVVQWFESRYQDFPGLNLTAEVLEGLQKHETKFDRPGGDPIFTPHLESQLVDMADEIAYLSADLEDGLRGDFFVLEDLSAVKIPHGAIASLDAKEQRDRAAIVRRIIRHMLAQLIADTQAHLKKHSIQSLEDVQRCPQRIVAFSSEFRDAFRALKQFLYDRYYLAPEVLRWSNAGKKVVCELFDFFLAHPDELPIGFMPDEPLPRRIADYIAGMTDEYAEGKWRSI